MTRKLETKLVFVERIVNFYSIKISKFTTTLFFGECQMLGAKSVKKYQQIKKRNKKEKLQNQPLEQIQLKTNE